MSDAMPASDLIHTEDLTITSALQKVMQVSRNHDQLAIGATRVAKILYRMVSQDEVSDLKLVILAKDLLPEYQTLITAKCKQFNIPIIYLSDRKELGSIIPIKGIKRTGAVGVRDFIYETREKAFVVNAIKE